MALEIGTVLGSYQIKSVIGSGGMATVYEAYQPKLDRSVAIKVMHESFTQDASFLARFEREARIVARLDHPNIVPVYDYDEIDKQPYLVMKLIEGVTLKDVLRKGRLQTDDILPLVEKVGSALHYAHQRGILHRDIKPSNIMLDMRGEPYLTDFGLARIAMAGESTMSAESMLGTPHYISPEQAKGDIDLDARTDVYSFGVVLYELVTGRVPFMGDTSYAIIHDQIYTPPPPPREIAPDVSEEVEEVILKALAKSPKERFATPVELVNAYKEAVANSPAPGTSAAEPARRPVSVPRPPQPPRAPSIEAPVHAPAQRSDYLFDDLGQELRDAGDEIRRGLSDARDEIRAAVHLERSRGRARGRAHRGNRQSWEPGKHWTTAPDGRQGFYSDDELMALEENMPEEERIRQRVRRRLKARQEIQSHLAAYIFVNLFLWMIWAMTTYGGHPWPLYPMGGWGIGLAFHLLDYYQKYGGGSNRREALIQRELERERERYQSDVYEKPKNDAYEPVDQLPLRLTEDGELSESFIQDVDQAAKRKNQ